MEIIFTLLLVKVWFVDSFYAQFYSFCFKFFSSAFHLYHDIIYNDYKSNFKKFKRMHGQRTTPNQSVICQMHMILSLGLQGLLLIFLK